MGLNTGKGTSQEGLVCDIDAGVDNLLKVMDQLLFDRKKVKTSPIAEAKTRTEKMNALFRILSKNGAHFNWSIQGKDPTSDKKTSEEILDAKNSGTVQDPLHLDIRIGEDENAALQSHPVRDFGFTAGHFGVTDLSQTNDPLKTNILNEFVNASQENSPLIPLLIDAQTIDTIPKEHQSSHHFYALALKSPQDQLNVFKKIVVHPRAKEMKVLGLKMKGNLASEIGALREVTVAEADGNYPFGDPLHLIGKPDLTYKRVIDPNIHDLLCQGWDGNHEKCSVWEHPKAKFYMGPIVKRRV